MRPRGTLRTVIPHDGAPSPMPALIQQLRDQVDGDDMENTVGHECSPEVFLKSQRYVVIRRELNGEFRSNVNAWETRKQEHEFIVQALAVRNAAAKERKEP